MSSLCNLYLVADFCFPLFFPLLVWKCWYGDFLLILSNTLHPEAKQNHVSVCDSWQKWCYSFQDKTVNLWEATWCGYLGKASEIMPLSWEPEEITELLRTESEHPQHHRQTQQVECQVGGSPVFPVESQHSFFYSFMPSDYTSQQERDSTNKEPRPGEHCVHIPLLWGCAEWRQRGTWPCCSAPRSCHPGEDVTPECEGTCFTNETAPNSGPLFLGSLKKWSAVPGAETEHLAWAYQEQDIHFVDSLNRSSGRLGWQEKGVYLGCVI